MFLRFRKFVRANHLFEPDDKVLLSVSGGIDSMVMMHLFLRAEFKVSVAHCNFGLRGTDSDEDANFVEEYAQSREVEFFNRKFQTKQFAKSNKISIQMAARELRRKWFEELVDRHEFACYATAHHLNDQTETFFINLFRGTGISGIHGILPAAGKLIHPMMFTWKKDIIRYARTQRVPYRLDKSNLTFDYDRNEIRHKLIPVIKEINPGFEKNLNDSIEIFRQAEAIYKQRISEIRKQILHSDGKINRLNIAELKKFDEAFTYLYEILSEYNFNHAVISDIYRSLSGESGKIFLSTTHRLNIDRGNLLIEKLSGSATEYQEYKINQDEQVLDLPVKLKLKLIVRSNETRLPEDPRIAMLDRDLLRFPLILRKWRKGDYFYPLGMTNKKLLSDYFIDNKFSVFQKERTWLLVNNSEIVWIVGHRIDNRFKITPATKNILVAEFFDA